MKSIVSVLLLLTANHFFAQNYQWQWAASVETDFGMNDAMIWNDADGNVYASASYYGLEINIGTYTLQNSNEFSEDILLVKYNTDGDILWAKGFGSTGTDRFLSAVCDSEGNTIVSGTTNSPSLTLDGFTITPVGGYDSFIAKLDADGNVMWAKRFGGTSNDFLRPINLDANNNIYATGYFYSPMLMLDDVSITNTGSPDMFVAKFDAGGATQWALGLTGDTFSSEIPTSIAVSPAGQCLFSGTFGTDVNIGPFTLSAVGGNDTFMSLVSADGTIQWAQTLQGASNESISDFDFVDEETFLCSGWFDGAEFIIGDETLVNQGVEGSDIFLASFQVDGTPNWAIGIGGDDTDNTAFIAKDGNDCFLTMGFESSTLSIGNYVFTNSGNDDVCFARINASGEVIWADAIGGEAFEFCNSISMDDNGNVYAGGSFASDQITFGEQELINASEFGNHVFVAKLAEIPTEVSDNSNKDAVSLYPNPCDEVMSVYFTKRMDSQAYAEIVSHDGRIVRSFSIGNTGPSFNFDTAQLSPGLYTLSIRDTEDNQSNIRFLVAR